MASDRDGTGLRSLAEASASPGLPKAPTGIRGLDAITEGGLPRATSTVVTGGTGSGMTLPGLQFLATGGREYGEPGALVTFVSDTSRTRPGPRPSAAPRDRHEAGVQVTNTLRCGYAGGARRGSP